MAGGRLSRRRAWYAPLLTLCAVDAAPFDTFAPERRMAATFMTCANLPCDK